MKDHDSSKEQLVKKIDELRQRVSHLENIGRQNYLDGMKKAEKKVLRKIFEMIPASVYALSPDHTIKYANRAFKELFDEQEPEGKSCYQVKHGRTMPCENCPTFKAFETKDLQQWEWTDAATGQTFMMYDNFFNDKDDCGLVLEFAIDITDRKKSEQALKESEEIYRETLSSISDSVFLTSQNGEFVFVCPNVDLTFGYSQDEVAALINISKLFGENLFDYTELESKTEIRNIEKTVEDKYGSLHTLLINVKRVAIKEASLLYVCRDITERKQVEEELEIKSRNLEEMNAALRVLLDKRDEDKKQIAENVLLNITELVIPTIENLKLTKLDKKQLADLDLIESNLHDIVSPFSRKLTTGYAKLSASELKLADFIRDGKSTKEIAELMSLSKQTIDTYRKNIRKKLKLTNKKENLRSFLLSIQ